MNTVFWEIIIVFLLTLLNGFFAMSEIALISVRKTRIAELSKEGNRKAKIIKVLQQSPEKLFATTQIGISVITILASAFAGNRLTDGLSIHVQQSSIAFIANNAYALSFTLVVAVVSYISLVLGELVPKSIGLRHAEKFALLAAHPIWWLSKLSYVLIKFLNFSSNLILKPFKDSTSFAESRLSEEEIRLVINEGKNTGAIEAHEHNIIENVFDFTDLTVGKIMVPRTQITAYDISQPPQEIVQKAIESGYSRVPIFQNTINKIVGILYTKKLLTVLGQDLKEISLQEFLIPPYFVPNSMKINDVLQRLQRKKLHMALVTDEHGEIEGLITLEDLLEEIVGEITDETDEANKNFIRQSGDSFLVMGETSVIDFNKFFNSELPEDTDFTTVTGFILDRLGRFPDEGDTITFGKMEFVVKEKTLRTVKSVLVKKIV